MGSCAAHPYLWGLGIIEKLLDGFVQTEYELAGNTFTTFLTDIHLYQGIYEIMDKTVQAAGATLEALNDDFDPRRWLTFE